MTAQNKTFLSFIFFTSAILVLMFQPSQVKAGCCDSGQCESNEVCVGVPSTCPDPLTGATGHCTHSAPGSCGGDYDCYLGYCGADGKCHSWDTGGTGQCGNTACTSCGIDCLNQQPPPANLQIQKTSSTSLVASWSHAGSYNHCAGGGYALIVGTDRQLVQSKCYNCGSSYPGAAGAYGDTCPDKDYPGGHLPPGCLATRHFGISTTSFNTATGLDSSGIQHNPIQLEPDKTYYFNVISTLQFNYKGDIESYFCGGTGNKGFLGQCDTTSSGGNTMSVGESQTFTTDINVPQTTTVRTPKYAGYCGVSGKTKVYGYFFGTGTDDVTLKWSPQVTNISWYGHQACPCYDSEGAYTGCTNKCPGYFVRDGITLQGIDFGVNAGGSQVSFNYNGTWQDVGVYDPYCYYGCATYSRVDIPKAAFGNNTSALPDAAAIAPITKGVGTFPVIVGGACGYGGGDGIVLDKSYPDITSADISYVTGGEAPIFNIDRVDYSGSPIYISINPASDSTPDDGYWTVVKALAETYPSSTPLYTDVYSVDIVNPPICSSSTDITIGAAVPVVPWWQVGDSDVQANGILNSKVPASKYFGLSGLGGYPGVAAYSATTNLDASNVSDKDGAKWLANSVLSSPKTFDYQYFVNQIPSDVVTTPVSSLDLATKVTSQGAEQYGYYWYKYDGTSGDLNLDSDIDIGNRKVVLLVENSNFNINGKINLTDNQGFFLVIVNGNIVINPSVGGGSGPNLEGLYVADGEVKTSTSGTNNDPPLFVRGSIVGYQGVSLDRVLSDNSDPAEYLEYAPDQILLFPSKLGLRKINWKEVAP